MANPKIELTANIDELVAQKNRIIKNAAANVATSVKLLNKEGKTFHKDELMKIISKFTFEEQVMILAEVVELLSAMKFTNTSVKSSSNNDSSFFGSNW